MINQTLRPTGCMAMNKLFCIFGDFMGPGHRTEVTKSLQSSKINL